MTPVVADAVEPPSTTSDRPGTARRRSLVSLVGSSTVQSTGFLIAGLMSTRLLPPAERGAMVLGTTIASVVALLTGLGTGSALRSRLPHVTGADRRRVLASYTWCSVISLALSSVITVLVCRASAAVVSPALGEPAFLGAIAFSGAAYATLTQFPDLWYAAGRFPPGAGWAAVVSAGGLVGMLSATAVGRSAHLLLFGQAVGMLAVATAQVAHLRRSGLLPVRRPARVELSELVRRGGRAVALTIGLALALRVDRYVIGAVEGPAAVAVYSLAATVGEAPRLVPAAIGQLLCRDVAVNAERADAWRPTFQAVVAAAVAGLAMVALGSTLIVPVFGDAFAPARSLVPVLVCAEIAFAPFAVASRGLLGGGWTGRAGAIGAVGSVAAMATYALAVPAGGLQGAAVGTALLYTALSAVTWATLRRRLSRRHRTGPATTPGAETRKVGA